MPYTMDNLPANVKKLKANKQRQWMHVWNSAYERCSKGGADTKVCETRAFKQANGVAMSADSGAIVSFAASEPVVLPGDPIYADDEIVVRQGLIFRAGDYPDKAYAMTPEELGAAAEVFVRAPIDLEHVPTILDGKLGHVAHVEAFGDELHGVVSLPAWLDEAIGDNPRKVSATWDRETKTLLGLALVLNPRVEDAALLSHFAEYAAKRHDTPHGRMALQDLHDCAARAGAVCKQANAAPMASAHENTAIQSIHDLTTSHGAACQALKEGSKPGLPYPLYSGENENPGPPPEGKGNRIMGFVDDVKKWFAAGMPDNYEPGTAPPPAPPAPAPVVTPAAPPAPPQTINQPGTTPITGLSVVDPATDELRRRAERAENGLRSLLAQQIADRAIAFADKQIRDGKAFPAERDAIMHAYAQAATDDNSLGNITFADGTPGTRVILLERVWDSRKGHLFSADQLPAQLHALVNAPTTDANGTPQTEEQREARRRELLNHSTLGKAALSALPKPGGTATRQN